MNFLDPSCVSGMTALVLGVALGMLSIESLVDSGDKVFNQIATFPVCLDTEILLQMKNETITINWSNSHI
jgi:hypothetical protein